MVYFKRVAVNLNAVFAWCFCVRQVLCHAVVNLLPGGESAHIQEQNKVRTDVLQSKSSSFILQCKLLSQYNNCKKHSITFFQAKPSIVKVVFPNIQFLELTTCLSFSVRISVLWIAIRLFPTLCLFFVQVLASVLMCLLDWLMVIPVSKLLSKTNEDENVSVLARVFQVKIQPLRDWQKCAILTHSEAVQNWARTILTDDVDPCIVSDWSPIARDNSKPDLKQKKPYRTGPEKFSLMTQIRVLSLIGY